MYVEKPNQDQDEGWCMDDMDGGGGDDGGGKPGGGV